MMFSESSPKLAVHSLANNIRLACHGYHSVRIEAVLGGRLLGWVEVWQGQLWAACAGDLLGEQALQKLLVEESATVSMEPIVKAVERNLLGTENELLRQPEIRVHSGEIPKSSKVEFERMLETGMDALLRRDLVLAWWAFVQADRLVPGTRTVQTNLNRLEEMGYSQGGRGKPISGEATLRFAPILD